MKNNVMLARFPPFYRLIQTFRSYKGNVITWGKNIAKRTTKQFKHHLPRFD